MKKLIAIIMIMALLLAGSGCGAKAGNNNSNVDAAKFGSSRLIDSGKINLNALEALKSKEEFASFMGVSNPDDMAQMLKYIKNYYMHLPYADQAAANSDSLTSEKGYKMISVDQAKALITPTVLTTDNWRDFFDARIKGVWNHYSNDTAEDLVEYCEEPVIGLKENYHLSSDLTLIVKNNVTDQVLTYNGWFWPEEVTFENGEFITHTYNDEIGELTSVFDINNYTCTWADGAVYYYDLDPSYRYMESFDEETFEYIYTCINDIEGEYDTSQEMVFVGNSDGSIDCICGYDGLGSYVYTNENLQANMSGHDKSIDIKPADSLSLELLQQLKTKDELAAILGIANLGDMKQAITYLRNYYYSLHSESDSLEVVTSYRTSDEGYNCISCEEGRAIATPYVITTENWKDFLAVTMNEIEYSSYDENGNEITETNQYPDVTIKPEYNWTYSTVNLELININTLEQTSFGGTWNGSLSVRDDKYYVMTYDDNGIGTETEFNLDDYACIYADATVYQYELPNELYYYEFYDEELEEWVVKNATDFAGNDDDGVIYVQYGEKNSDICRVGKNGFGNYVYVDGYFQF